MIEALSQFRDAICACGLKPPDVIKPDVIQRFPGYGKRPGNQAGWCRFFSNGLCGCFGDWSTGLFMTWHAKSGKPISQAERVAYGRRISAAKKQAEAERKARQADAASRAAVIWNEAMPAPCDHRYLIQKHIPPFGARIHSGELILPVMNFDGQLTSLQYIAANGSKRLLRDGQKQGCFIPVNNELTEASCIIICEGWATGCTLAEDEPTAMVLAAIDAGNLKSVAMAARCQWPSAYIVIAGDDDRLTPGNPGATKSKAAAIASDAHLALPRWPEDAPDHLTDFNDLAVWLAEGKA